MYTIVSIQNPSNYLGIGEIFTAKLGSLLKLTIDMESMDLITYSTVTVQLVLQGTSNNHPLGPFILACREFLSGRTI